MPADQSLRPNPTRLGARVRPLLSHGLAALSIVAAAAFGGCASSSTDAVPHAPNAQPGKISLGEFYFRSATIKIKAGDSVTWQNVGKIPHTVKGPGFQSRQIDPGGSFEHRFNKPGTFKYLCTLHPTMMRGLIEVTGGGS